MLNPKSKKNAQMYPQNVGTCPGLPLQLLARNLFSKLIGLNPSPLKGGGGGVQGQKSWKHDFEITDDPKGPPSGSTFWSGFEAPDS